MPYDSNGVFSLDPGYLAVLGQTIQPSNHNPPLEDIITAGLSNVLVRDGRAPMVGNLNMNGFKATSLLAGTNALDAVNKAQLDTKPDLAGNNTFTGENTFTKTQIWAKGADVASATALALGDDGNYFDVTGTTAITSIGTVGVGAWIKLHFDGVLTLTHNATDLVLPGGVNITTAAGDEAEFVEYAAGDWRCTNFSPANSGFLHVRDQKAQGTSGGSASAGVNQRTLNTVVTNEISGASLASSVITLPAGTYDVYISAPAFLSNAHKAYLQTSGGGAVLMEGTSEFCGSAANYASTRSMIVGRLTLAASTNMVVQHSFQSSVAAASGLGLATNVAGRPEIFTEAMFQKVA